MLDTSTVQRDRVGLCRGAIVQDREQILEFASIGHGAPAPAAAGMLWCRERSSHTLPKKRLLCQVPDRDLSAAVCLRPISRWQNPVAGICFRSAKRPAAAG